MYKTFTFFYKILLAIILSTLITQTVSAGGSFIVERGKAPTINWVVGGGATQCTGTTGYPSPSSIFSAWNGSIRSNTGAATLPVALAVGGPYWFTCRESSMGISDTANLTVQDCGGSLSAGRPSWNGSACVAAGAAPTVTVTWTPSTITAGGTSAIRIRSSDPSATCTANLTGPTSWSGGIPATFDNSYTFPVAGPEVATITCTNGSGTGSGSATLTINPVGAPLVNGVCSASHYNCSSGTVSGPSENATQWTWQCLGSGGGASPVCSDPKPPAGTCGGYQTWGSGCSATFPVTAVGDNTPSTNNTGADYAGWAVMKCLSPGAFGYVSGSCAYTPTGGSDPCPQGVYKTWGSGCGGNLDIFGLGDVAHGGSRTVTSVTGGYSGNATYQCNNGAWFYSGGTCTALGGSSDLTVGFVSPLTATAGVPQTFSGTVSNIGSGGTGASFNNFLQENVGFTRIGAVMNTPRFIAGESRSISTTYTFATPGSYVVRMCADKSSQSDTGTISESNESNNCGAWSTVVVSSAPSANLITQNITPTVGIVGVPLMVQATVRNTGTGGTGVAFPTYFEVMPGSPSGVGSYGAASVGPLGAGGTATTQNLFNFFASGTYIIRACADKNNSWDLTDGAVSESVEGFADNCTAPTNVVVSNPSCANGANNPPTCNQCPVNLYWNTTTSSCSPCGSTGCTGPGGNPSTPIPPTLVCNNGGTPPACTPLPTASLLVGATNLSYNGQTTLTWSSTGASPSGCVAGGPWLNSPNNAGSGLTDPLTMTSTFTFQCTGPSGTSALVSRTITVCPSASPIWTGAVCRPLPSVGPLGLTGQYTPAGTLDFTCNDADRYEVWKGLRTVGTVIRASTAYPGAMVHVPVTAVTGAGNYNVYCSALDWTGARIWSSPSAKWYSPVVPTPPIMSITASPKTIQKGSESAITWNVKYPNSACKITASPVCSGECTTAKDGVKIENTRLLNSKLTSPSEMTDANDPNGRRKVTESFWKPINPLADDKISAGKKTFLFNSTTDFTLDCNTTVPLTTDPVKKVRVNVTSSNEG